MGSVILIVFSLVVISIIYYWDSRRHDEIMVKTMISIHSRERYMIREKAKAISKKYPMLSKAALSFANTEIKFTSEETVNNAKSLPKKAKEELDVEIQRIIDEMDDSAVEVAHWYMMTCIIIHASTSKERISEISEQSKKISKNQYDDDIRKDLCLA